MARAERDVGALTERDKKFQKLTKMIKAREKDVEMLDRRMAAAREKAGRGDISKGEFQRQNIELMRRRKGLRGTITRLERSRLNRERMLKDKQREREEKESEKEQRRIEREERRKERREERGKQKGKGKDED